MLRGNRRTVLTVLAIVLGALAAGFAASIVLAGCSGEPSTPPTTPPATTADPSPTPTPTPTPTPDAATPPQRPDMSTVDADTAEAVATYFVALFPYAFASGDLADWDALSHPACVYCASVRAGVDEFRAEGLRSVGGEVAVTDATATETVAGQMWMVTFTMTEQPSETVNAGGDVVETFPDTKTYDSVVLVVNETGSWQVREVTHDRRPS